MTAIITTTDIEDAHTAEITTLRAENEHLRATVAHLQGVAAALFELMDTPAQPAREPVI